MLTCHQKAGLKVNASKLFFGAHKFDYSGYHVTCDRVIPIPKKVEVIQDLAVPKTWKQLCQFIGMIKLYCDMWQNRFNFLPPLTDLTPKNIKYDWKDEHQKFFDAIKCVIRREVLLAYPDLNDANSYTKERQHSTFISDFRELNKRILCQPYPIPKIQDLSLRLDGFHYRTTLDLNMGYCYFELSVKSK